MLRFSLNPLKAKNSKEKAFYSAVLLSAIAWELFCLLPGSWAIAEILDQVFKAQTFKVQVTNLLLDFLEITYIVLSPQWKFLGCFTAVNLSTGEMNYMFYNVFIFFLSEREDSVLQHHSPPAPSKTTPQKTSKPNQKIHKQKSNNRKTPTQSTPPQQNPNGFLSDILMWPKQTAVILRNTFWMQCFLRG